MYVDKDTQDRLSLMEISEEQAYIVTEALIRYATNPQISESHRETSKKIAYLISKQYEDKL